ncbi:uncharacterized protein LOC101342429 [Trichechus manatus latirostris]|uniref:Uncharacterized protein LOC101342429 n=1 Tax=Trichechus manatus latirostris TaxID=127582 RepID=A0A2Y9RE44_TRIMA|nr:uncharacterized protein LOC101342429 [Trichechus manatus latirostris]
MLWYHQLLGQTFTLIVTSDQGSGITDEQGFMEGKFPISHPDLTFSTLMVTSAQAKDSSLYSCSASDTAPHRDQGLEQEPLPGCRLLLPMGLWALWKWALAVKNVKGHRVTRRLLMGMSSLREKAANPAFPDQHGPTLLCLAVLCFLGAGPVDPEVIQSPRHFITRKGGQAILQCHPASGHTNVYWYQQTQGQGPQFLFRYYNGKQQEKGDIPDRFSGQQFSEDHSELNLSALELGDSAVFLCASSLAQPCRATSHLYPNLLTLLRM